MILYVNCINTKELHTWTSKHHFHHRSILQIRHWTIKGSFALTLLHLFHSVVLCMMAILLALCALSTMKHLPPFLRWATEDILVAHFIHKQIKEIINSKWFIYMDKMIWCFSLLTDWSGQNYILLIKLWRNAIHRPHEVKGWGKMNLSIEFSFPSCQLFLDHS